jgi:hypothetical protein
MECPKAKKLFEVYARMTTDHIEAAETLASLVGSRERSAMNTVCVVFGRFTIREPFGTFRPTLRVEISASRLIN